MRTIRTIETGVIFLTLWDDAIEKVEIGKTYKITNSYTNIFRSSLRLNLGKFGELSESDEEITEVNNDNNLSEREYQSRYPSRSGYGRRPSYRRGGYGDQSYGRDKYSRNRRPPYKRRY